MLPFAGILLVSMLIFAVTSWLEGIRGIAGDGQYLWLVRLEPKAAVDTLSNAAEVVAAVLAIAITVVAIVVELAANRYTHRITQLFVRAPVNALVMSFFVVTAVQCLWVSASLSGQEAAGEASVEHYAGVVSAMGMVTFSLLILLPYFAYVFAFLDPVNIVSRLGAATLRSVRRAGRGGVQRHRWSTVAGIEELEDVALNAMEHKDRGITMASVDILEEILEAYQPLRSQLADDWFRIDGRLAHDPDFVSMAPAMLEEIESQRTWFEIKVLRQYHALFIESLNRMRDVSNLIALNTRRIADTTSADGDDHLVDLVVRFFNSYLRAAVNAKDIRSAYYVLHQYRLVAETLLDRGEDDTAIRVAEHFRFYGQLGFTQQLPFLLEAVAYDLSLVVEKAASEERPCLDALLDVFLEVDRESESMEQEERLRGVRRAQVMLATFLLERGDVTRARKVYEDMAEEKPERLRSIRDELLNAQEPLYWELTDRGVNFAYLPPERRRRVVEFFDWYEGSLA
jgi:hypothetical protein